MPRPFRPDSPRRAPVGSRPLADLVGPCIQPALGKQGFGEADVLMHWPEIVGGELAESCRPLRLQWRGRRGEGGGEPATLVVRVESAAALRLQHMESVILERVNTYLGWRCVGRLAMRQGPLPLHMPRPNLSTPVDPRAAGEARRAVANIDDAGLRDALQRLGARALQPARRWPPEK